MATRPPLDSFFEAPDAAPKDFPVLNPSKGAEQPQKKSLLQKATGVAEKVTNAVGLKGTVDYLGNVGANLAHPKLGSEGLIPQPNLKQAFGAGTQLSAIANPAGAGGGLLKTAGLGALEGAAMLGGGAAAEDKPASEIATETKRGAKFGGIFGVAGKALQGGGKMLYKALIPTGTREAQLVQSYKATNSLLERMRLAVTGQSKGPVTVGETSFNKGLMGTESMLGVQAKQAKTTLWNDLVQPALNKSDKQVDMGGFFDAVEQKIVSGNADFTRRHALLEALQSMRDDFSNFRVADLPQLQKFKEGWAKFLPDKVYKGKPIGAAFKEVQEMAADEARDAIYKTLGPEVRRAYLDYGNLIALEELGVKAMTGGKLRGGMGSFFSGLYEMALTPVATIGGRTVYKIGEGITLVGPSGVGTLGQLLEAPDSGEDQQETQAPTGRPPLESFQQ